MMGEKGEGSPLYPDVPPALVFHYSDSSWLALKTVEMHDRSLRCVKTGYS